jgi:predicted transcriptional regulator
LAVTGGLIKKLRIQAELTQRRLAELVGVSQAHIAKIELGKVDPRLSTVNRIMGVLRVGQEKKCKDIMTKGVIFAKPNESILTVSEVMVKNAVSQLPVLEGNKVVGTITEESIIRNLRSNLADEKAQNVMNPPMTEVPEGMSIDDVRALMEKTPSVLVVKGREIIGIVTRSDLLKTIE